jgi:uncharacterized protein (TIGR03435 family)
VESHEKELVQMMRGKISLHAQPVKKLCDFLTTPLHSIVVDETGMKGRYDFDLPYQPGQPDVTTSALSLIGLEAVKMRRSVVVLVVQP